MDSCALLSLARAWQVCVTFKNKLVFYSEELNPIKTPLMVTEGSFS
jgi:hypothetical protein